MALIESIGVGFLVHTVYDLIQLSQNIKKGGFQDQLNTAFDKALKDTGVREVSVRNDLKRFVADHQPDTLLYTPEELAKAMKKPEPFGARFLDHFEARIIDNTKLYNWIILGYLKEILSLLYAIAARNTDNPENIKIENIQKLFPQESATPVRMTPQYVPSYPLQKNFTGRFAERQMLTDWFANDEQPVMVMEAIGGMGKSALTWVWANADLLGLPLAGLAKGTGEHAAPHQLPEADRPQGVFWFSFYEREAHCQAFLVKALQYVSGGLNVLPPNASVHDLVETLIALLQERRILLVLDGFERELRAYRSLNAAYQGDEYKENEEETQRDCTNPHAAQFLSRVVSTPMQGRILMTSRLFPKALEGQAGQPLAGCRHENLTEMHSEDGVTFFQLQGVKGTRAEIQEACQPYGNHPLALRLLAGLIVKNRKTPRDVQVAKKYFPLPKLVAKEHHVLMVAYKSLEKKHKQLLSRFAAFRSPMDYKALTTFDPYKDEGKFNQALTELEERGLLLHQDDPDSYDLHPIVRQYAYERLGDKEGVHAQLRDYFSAVPKPEKVETIDDLTPTIELYHHTVRAARYDEAINLLQNRLVPNPLHFQLGEYQTIIELLRALFPDGEDNPPRLKSEGDQAWTLNGLANSYGNSGQPHKAVSICELAKEIYEKNDEKNNLAVVLVNLTNNQILLGRLSDAEYNLKRSIELCQHIEDEFKETIGREELGRLLAFKGEYEESASELNISTKYCKKTNDNQGLCLDESYRALLALFMREAKSALNSAKNAYEIVCSRNNERDRIQSEWLMGWSHVELAVGTPSRKNAHLKRAENHLTEALTRCRKINMVDHEADILLTWAKWHRAKGNNQEAFNHAQEALKIADRCEYRLQQADIHNFLAQWHLDQGDKTKAHHHAQKAKDYALCDGPPHCYKSALNQAEQLLAASIRV
ncbi:hypothetical protein CEE37_06905 [candidate division LCP-89 bacterium B3_LCP]|uniref:MalT-like TPR region domain-containing protein n=1 Tax=candidate division LCP-89 bacterium B3_LCP TaxID=2012998 RepID=A0A532V0E1_UNCL8|nr:MAG: hypothetical protein CEE37_06905 [candidate division LCP-89 bacterium B3_LCP]